MPSPSDDFVSDSPSLEGSLIVCCSSEMVAVENGSKQERLSSTQRSQPEATNRLRSNKMANNGGGGGNN